MAVKDTLYKNIGWRLVLDFFSRGLFFLINILIARVLGVKDFGKFAYAISLAQIFYTFTDLGTLLQMSKELGEKRKSQDSSWVRYLELKIILMSACTVVFLGLTLFMWKWEHPWLLMLALMWMFSNSLMDFNQFVCNGLGRLDIAKNSLIVQRVWTVLSLAVALIFYRTLAGVLIGLGVGGLLGSFFSNLRIFRDLGIKCELSWAPSEWKRILVTSIPNGVSNTFGAWYLRIAPILLGWVASAQVLGEYTGAFRLFETTYIIPAAILAVSLPHLTEAFKEGDHRYKSELWRLGRIMIPSGFAFGMIFFVGSGIIVPLLLGQEFEGSIVPFRILGLVATMVFLNYFVTHLMIVIGAQRRHALHQFLVFISSLVFHILFIPKWGALGASWALFSTELVLFVLTATFLLWWHRANPREALAIC